MKEYKIYGLTEPHGPMKHIYIGFTMRDLNERLGKHITRVERNYKCSWIKSLQKLGLQPRIFLIKLTDAKNWAKDEREEIERWRLTQEATGIKVLNMTDGGEGTLGHKHSIETRELFSRQRKGGTHKPHSPETKKKMSQSSKGHQRNKGRKQNQEEIAKRLRFGKDHWAYGLKEPEEQTKRRTLKTRKLTDEQILQVKEAVKSGTPQHEVAKLFGVGHGTVGRIVHNQLAYLKRWPSGKLQEG